MYKIYNPEKLREQMDQILNQFLEGSIVETMKRSYTENYGIPSDSWSALNKILMMLAGTNDGRTLNAWNREGRKIKAGSKSFRIIAPVYVDKWELNEKTGKKEKNGQILVGFRGQPEFRYEDTEAYENNPQKEIEYNKVPTNLPTMMEIAKQFNAKVKMDKYLKNAHGSYNPVTMEISMKNSDFGTYFHELVHHVHNTIMLEKKNETLKGGQHADQEVIAEFGSLVLVTILGFKPDPKLYKENMGYTLHYLKAYLNTSDNEKVVRGVSDLISDIDEILKRILKIIKVKKEYIPTIPIKGKKKKATIAVKIPNK